MSLLAILTTFWVLSVVEGKVVFLDTFNSSQPLDVGANTSSYSYFESLPFVGNDGKIIQNKPRTVTIDIRPVQLTVPVRRYGTLDHVKNLIFHKNYWAVNSNQVLSCELKTKTKVFGSANNPFGKDVTDANNDMRLGTCGLVMLDLNSFSVADFLQTDKENIPMHERLGFGQDQTGSGLGYYKAFTTTRTGKSKRNNPYDYNTLKIVYDRGAGTLKWYGNGKLINTVTTIGIPTSNMRKVLDLGGNTTTPIEPQGYLCGFGCFTLLDFSNPLDSASTKGLVKLVDTPNFYVHPSNFVDPDSKNSSRIWNKLGMMANHAHFKVDIRTKN